MTTSFIPMISVAISAIAIGSLLLARSADRHSDHDADNDSSAEI